MNLSLFDTPEDEGSAIKELPITAPLAAKMRPQVLEDFMGQRHFMGEGKMLRRMIETKRLSSLLFYGPPGTGKTTLARLIAGATEARFVEINATESNVKELRAVLEASRAHLRRSGKKSLLFIDEIHRFNRAQQDVLLPDVENGFVVLVGATTMNPSFSVNSPLLSRSQLFRFESLDEEAQKSMIERALALCSEELGVVIELDEQGRGHLLGRADGDGRRLLNGLELAIYSTPAAGGVISLGLEDIEEAIQTKATRYDRDGDDHYDVISAFIKSVRGSDADAAIYWLARMLDAGEDIRFISRRLVILASEDIGNASPQALSVATSAAQAVEFIGMPEARIILAQATTFLATAPKSNASYVAIDKALSDVRNGVVHEVPKPLRDGHYKGAKEMGNSVGYLYPHSYPGHWVAQEYLPGAARYYEPSDQGYEARIAERMDATRRGQS